MFVSSQIRQHRDRDHMVVGDFHLPMQSVVNSIIAQGEVRCT